MKGFKLVQLNQEKKVQVSHKSVLSYCFPACSRGRKLYLICIVYLNICTKCFYKLINRNGLWGNNIPKPIYDF